MKDFFLFLSLWVSPPLGGGRLGAFGGCEMGVFTLFALFTLPTRRMLHAGGQRLTFCTDHIHHYYHHCFSSNSAEHHIPMRHKPTKWENGRQFRRTCGKVRRAGRRESGRQQMASHQSRQRKTAVLTKSRWRESFGSKVPEVAFINLGPPKTREGLVSLSFSLPCWCFCKTDKPNTSLPSLSPSNTLIIPGMQWRGRWYKGCSFGFNL